MSNVNNENSHGHSSKPNKRSEMTRRQFLAYTLGGTTAFLAAGPLIPMVRFAADPILRKKEKADFVKVVEESKVTTEPVSYKFTAHQVDGWYESDPDFEAWILKGENGVYALSPICKHLGCTIGWNNDPATPEQFMCPCHNAHYDKDGKNLIVAPNPLDEYEVKVENGWVYLGGLKPNSRV